MESPLLKAVRELNESMARLKSTVSMQSPVRNLLEANRKQKQLLAGFEAFHRRQQQLLDSFSQLSMLGKRR